MKWSTFTKNFAAICRLQWKYNKSLAVYFVLLQITGKLKLYAGIYCAGAVLDAVTYRSEGSFKRILLMVALIVGSELLNEGLQFYSNFRETLTQYDADESLRIERLRKISRIKMDYFETNALYRSNANISQFNAGTIYSFFISCIMFLSGILSIVIAAVALVSISPWIGLLFFLTYVPVCLWETKKGVSTIKFAESRTNMETKLNSLFAFIAGRTTIQELKLFQSFDRLIQQRKKLFGKMQDESVRFNLKMTNRSTLLKLVPTLLYYGIYFALGLGVWAAKMTIGNFWVAIELVGNLNTELQNTSSHISSIASSFKRANDFMEFFEYEEEKSDGKPLDESADIVFRNLTYSYPESGRNALNGLSVTIKNGERTAIVGHNGAGKTTLSKLLLGLYNDYEGDILFGQTEAREIANRDRYAAFSVAFQDYCKYPFGMRENISMSDKVDSERYKYALACSGCDTIAETLPQGDQTPLNKEYDADGTDLSEGQWHSVVLARTFYRQTPFLLFDEPTASLDPMVEYRFIRDILDRSEGKTVIYITHRLACMHRFDNIIVLEDGAVAEQGTHRELIEKQGIYFKMWSAQAEKYGVEFVG